MQHLAQLGRMLLLALALAGQISAGALAMPSDASQDAAAARSALDAAMVFCQAGGHDNKDSQAPLHHHLSEPAIAAASLPFAQLAAITGAAPAVPPPAALPLMRIGLPEARGPPVHYAASAYPRGPPALL